VALHHPECAFSVPKDCVRDNQKSESDGGTTTGTGFIIARTSIAKGAKTVLLLNRPSERATKTEEELKAFIVDGSKTTVETIPCDLQDFSSVRAAAEKIKADHEAIDVLCNNAGVMALEDKSKLANSVFTKALADKFGDSGIKAAVAAPGMSSTNLTVSTNKDGGMGSGNWFMRFSQSAEDGAMPVLAACFDPSTNNGDFWEPQNRGNLIGPAVKVPWDKMSKNPENAKLLWKESEEACGAFTI
jgi:NAD(P)-dependent dehydrogenase (short-subunit alcohol dehydrogenase family)